MKNCKDSKILVAGYNGMVGSTIYSILKEKGYSNFVLADYQDIDFRRQKETEDFFELHKPDFVFLAAAKVGGIVANNTYKADFIYDNIAIAMNIIHSSYKYGVKKLLNLGSSCIYPKFAPQPIKEEYLLTGELEQTNEPYAIAKITAIKLCKYYNYQYKTNYISVMPTNLYGSRDNFNLETSHVLPALVRKMVLAKKLSENDYDFVIKDINKYHLGFGFNAKADNNNLDLIISSLDSIGVSKDYVKIWGSGNVRREFLHVNDMANACVYIMENYDYSEIGDFINIGTGIDLYIKELAELIKEIVGFTGELIFDSTKPEGTPQKLLDVSRLNNLGWKAKIELKDGIKNILDFYLN